VFLVTLAAGAATIAAISLSPLYARRLRVRGPHPGRSARLGAVLVASSITLGALSFSTSGRDLPPRDQFFLLLFGLFFVGAVLILSDEPDEDDGGEHDDPSGDPPWWPEFEADFGRYVSVISRRMSSKR
jgi:hypothetical protein